MKYYIVSEEELNELSAAWSQLFLIERAEAACRARPADKLLAVVEAAKYAGHHPLLDEALAALGDK